MSKETQDLIAFRLTGKRPDQAEPKSAGDASNEAGASALRPVLFAGYSDLCALRYDFPVVLMKSSSSGAPVVRLTDVMNEVIGSQAALGAEGEFERGQLLGLERQIRQCIADGATGSLLGIWNKAQAVLLKGTKGQQRTDLKSCFERALKLVDTDGVLLDCNETASQKIVEHIWSQEVAKKASRFQARAGGLIIRLERILEADYQISGGSQEPGALKDAIGDSLAASFDFKALSDLLKTSDTHDDLPENRVDRIMRALTTLKAQRFFVTPFLRTDERSQEPSDRDIHKYVFKDCTKAHDAFLDRLPEMVQLVKAISIAELEIDNGYKPQFHDDYFLIFDQTSLVPEDLDMFPSCLAVCKGQAWKTGEKGRIIDTLSSGLPIKILVQTDDIIPLSSLDAGAFSRGLAGAQFASLAVGLGSSFVLQTSASNLYKLHRELRAGLESAGPTLFSVYSGVGETTTPKGSNVRNKTGSYLSAAAAMEGRAFPTFVFDPTVGSNLATRFSLLNNPDGLFDWPQYALDCEAEDLQRTTVELAFTFADFVAADRRYHHHFARVAKVDWVDEMVSVGEYLTLSPDAASTHFPYVLMINEFDEASRYVVDELVIRATLRIRDIWRGLQEMGGVNNSHAVLRLEEERAKWEVEKESELAALRLELETATVALDTAPAATPVPATAGAIASAPASESVSDGSIEAAVEEVEEALVVAPPPSDDLWIETARCTTCNECTDLNDQIFAYNEDMQAYVLDAECGPYKDIIEAAENCQVAIIHPGKPKNLNEPDLDDLIKRAELFQ